MVIQPLSICQNKLDPSFFSLIIIYNLAEAIVFRRYWIIISKLKFNSQWQLHVQLTNFKSTYVPIEIFFSTDKSFRGGGGGLRELHLKDRIGWLHHVNRCVCGDSGRGSFSGLFTIYCVRFSKMRTYNTKYVILFLPYTRSKSAILLAGKWYRWRYNVVNRMYGTFYWTRDIPHIFNTTITIFTTEF